MLGVRDHDGTMMDTEEELPGALMPFRMPFTFGKFQYLEGMPVWITKIKGLDTAGVGIPIREPLRPGESMLHLVLSQPTISLVQVVNNAGDVLKPAIVRARIDRDRSSGRSEVLESLDTLIAKAISTLRSRKPNTPSSCS